MPWAEAHEHSFENLIALCPNCHTRYDRGEIDRQSMQRYKWNLGVVNSRYGDFEKRLLVYFAERPDSNAIDLMGSNELQLMNLIADGLLEDLGESLGANIIVGGMPTKKTYLLTESGRAFIDHWLAADELT